MKAIKIDIKKEYIDIPKNQPVYRVAELPSMVARMAREGEACPIEPMNISETTYNLQHIHNPDTEPKDKYYLIKQDERELFKEMLEISNSMIKRKMLIEKADGVVEGKEIGIDIGIRRGKRAVWSLPWYKRLFKLI